MYNFPWKTKGIVLTAPQPYKNEEDDVVKFIENILVPAGINLIVLQTRYRYQFKKHPECQGFDPLSYDYIKQLLSVCKKNNIRLVPKMNLIGHQSGVYNTPSDGILHGLAIGKFDDFPDALLRAYPFLEEKQEKGKWLYSRHLCTRHPLLPSVLFDLIDELCDVFEADAMHIGCDESFGLGGDCHRCKDVDKGQLFAEYVNSISNHLKEHNVKTMIWSDRLLDMKECEVKNKYEYAESGAETAINIINKDVICCDWHYENMPSYKSVDVFAEYGMNMMISPWCNAEAAKSFAEYAIAHDKGHILGYLQTTWCSSGELARYYLYGIEPEWVNTPKVIDVLNKMIL